jgi:hypothetical protein
MAYSSAALSANVLAAMAADKPLILGTNVLRDMAAADLQWRTTGSFSSGSSGTDTSYPTRRLYDGYVSLATRPSSAQNTWYLLMQWSSAVAFDSICIIGHNFGAMTVTLQVADDAAFTSNLVTLATWTLAGATLKRQTSFALTHAGGSALKYSAVSYARLKFDGTSLRPEIAEILLGERRQLLHNPAEPWAPDDYHSEVSDVRTLGGQMTRYMWYRGQRRISAELSTYDTASATDLVTLYTTDLAYGTKPFLWVDQPTTAPQKAFLMMLDDPDQSIPYDGPCERNWQIEATEQGDRFVSEETY